ncbi:MAG: succinate dehydrogenase cytochrome b subunit [Bacteroidia bacterium]|jgi:succinate dehydrogenase / fumarate reductase cytochrome b subunit|nr:succinate dehydrogenase cytochrome b subunit [Bacteroidia bacterium]
MTKFLTSSLGKKTVMALSGLFLCLFLLEHLYTNVHLFFGDGGKEFNEASHSMVHSILIRIIEVVLFLAIVVHVAQALLLTKENSDARPVKYAVDGTSKTSDWFSRNMLLTGSIIFFFIVVHLYNFFVPYRVTGHVVGPEEAMATGGETLAMEVAEALSNPIYAIIYLISVLLLAFHLNHGFQSAFQTLGINNQKYSKVWKMASVGFAVLIGVGFGAFPIFFQLAKYIGFDALNWNM